MFLLTLALDDLNAWTQVITMVGVVGAMVWNARQVARDRQADDRVRHESELQHAKDLTERRAEVNSRLSMLETGFSAMRQELNDLDANTRISLMDQKMDGMKSDMQGFMSRMDKMMTSITTRIDQLGT